MTAATPLLVADILTTPSVAAPASGAQPQDDLLAASSFAALLHIANFVADAPAHTPQAAPEREPTAGEPQEERPAQDASAVVEGLLFLSSVIAPEAVVATAGQVAAAVAPAHARPTLVAASHESLAEAPTATRLAGFAPKASALPFAPQAIVSSTDVKAAAQPADIDAAALFAASPANVGTQDDRASLVDANIVALPARDDASRGVENGNEPFVTAKPAPMPIGVTAVTPSNAPSTPMHAVATVTIETPAFEPGWHDEVAHRVAALTVRGTERAELRLSPAELGPVELRIHVRDGEASVSIVALNPTTRDALEQALPALREMLAERNVSLGEASVHDGRSDDASRHDSRHAAPSPVDETARATEASAVALVRVARLVDVFA